MVLPLEGDKLVHGGERLRIRGANANLAAARQVVHAVGNRIALRRHHRGAGHFPVVHEGRRVEVTPGERRGDLVKVLPDLRDTGGIVHVALQLDATAVGHRVEPVR